MVSLRGPAWVGAAGFVLVAVGLGFLLTGAPIVGIGFCALAVGLVAVAVRDDDETDTSTRAATPDEPADDALATLRERYARGDSRTRSSRRNWNDSSKSRRVRTSR
ncbi:hypothetical protein [Halogeometricum sp. CBA1124]|uniref:hypothetical protein n=1 Tax=Halogeometricum sp. CBA1124 TaxID=2668071 RepID=UPI001E4C7895|nr:hypothetical protein [Halogeometricum sp. CBA1124]